MIDKHLFGVLSEFFVLEKLHPHLCFGQLLHEMQRKFLNLKVRAEFNLNVNSPDIIMIGI